MDQSRKFGIIAHRQLHQASLGETASYASFQRSSRIVRLLPQFLKEAWELGARVKWTKKTLYDNVLNVELTVVTSSIRSLDLCFSSEYFRLAIDTDMEGPIHIQPADWNDPRTRDMIATHFQYFTDLEVGTTFNDPPSLDEYIESLRGPNDAVWIAWNYSLDSVLGCGALKMFLTPISGHDGKEITSAGEIRTMHTLPAARGQGVGRKLLQHIEQIARDAGLTRLYIETGALDGYVSARRLYAKAGFKQCGVFGRYSEHPDIYCMVKEL